jgi:hypothetical protein
VRRPLRIAGRAALRPMAVLALTVSLAGCGVLPLQPVQPWERGNLAKPTMTFETNPLEAAYHEHIYASKENASGGNGVGGGGCGCN